MPLQSTSGAASYDAFGGGAAAKVNYIEDFFQSYLRTGTGASATVTTGLDGSTKETLVWTKSRSAATNHKLTDNVRGATKALSSNTTGAEATDSQGLTAFSATGYTIGTNTDYNNSGATYVDWQWVAQPKFFDVVTYTGNGALPNQLISHNLGSVPGCIIIKATNASGNWIVWHRGNGTTNYTGFSLNLTSASAASVASGDLPTATQFKPAAFFDPDYNGANSTGVTYVAYLFAHDAGGFGLTGTDNVISCGSFTASMGSLVNIGFEPQFVLIKRTDTSSVDDWLLFDNMRGLTMGDDSLLNPNTSGAENNSLGNNYINPQPTGFTQIGFGSGTYIYIAIRRGPMKVPTSGTSVFDTQLGVSSTTATISSGFVTDTALALSRPNGASGYGRNIYSRLQGNFQSMNTTMTDAESTFINSSTISFSQNNGIKLNGGTVYNANWVYEQFRRAPSFFDVVCYTGTGANRTVAHNLGVAPELIMLKNRSAGGNDWVVYSQPTGNQYAMYLNLSYQGDSGSTAWNSTSPTSSVFSLGASGGVNGGGSTFVAYLFATCAGVSKCFSYTGNGSSQTINCGFTGGARWILIKRTDSTGDWYVWDSVRGIVSGNDPHLSLNTTAAEVTTDDTIDTDSTGFVVNQVSATNVNVSSATYIGLAIA